MVVSEADGFVDIVVRLSEPSASTVSVNYSTANGTASNGFDYTGIGSTPLTFAAGETTKTVRIFLTENTSLEG
ncbi:MAG TPA: Calx-beta domain-containing protein, partial [Burkholderiaceae bacterium]|nr:Calx-beta domain-containing protein [Burkholderiaceae bacterium]